jgi:hypothetical protein
MRSQRGLGTVGPTPMNEQGGAMAAPVTEERPDAPPMVLSGPVALTRWPDLFAVGVTLAGMSDLRTFLAGSEPWMAAASVTEYDERVAAWFDRLL